MRDLECAPETLVGPVDDRVVAWLQKRYPLGPDFLACMKACHGGSPKLGAFKVGKKSHQIAMFLSLLDAKSTLPPPFRPHFDDRRMDERAVNSITFVKDYEHATSRALFGNLLPFAATLKDMCLDRAYVDLVCLDYRQKGDNPPVVLWIADRAHHAYMEWDRLPFTEKFDEQENFTNVPWDDFVKPVAPDFATFIEMLGPVKVRKTR